MRGWKTVLTFELRTQGVRANTTNESIQRSTNNENTCLVSYCLHHFGPVSYNVFTVYFLSHDGCPLVTKGDCCWPLWTLCEMELLRYLCSKNPITVLNDKEMTLYLAWATTVLVADHMLPNYQVCILHHLPITVGLLNKNKINKYTKK